jgi:hypothetical protein
MNFVLNRRIVLASLALGSAGVSQGQPATTPDPTPTAITPGHPDLALKLMIIGRRKPGTTLAEHRQHIRRVHGELVLQSIAVDPANSPRRYVQNPVIDGTFRTTAPGTDPFALNRDFVTQVWFPDFPSLARARQSPFYLAHLKGDEDNFVDQATVAFVPVRERVVTERGTPTRTSVKLFGFLPRVPEVHHDGFRRAWRVAPWATGAAVTKLQRYAQNDTLPTPAGPAPVEGIDEFWFDDEAGARGFLKAWQTWVAESLVRPGLVADGSAFALLAHEDVVHTGPR